jgi:hypothetical protein
MKLKTVALISLTLLVGREIVWLFLNYGFVLNNFWRFALSSVDNWVLIFFFAMLYVNSKD